MSDSSDDDVTALLSELVRTLQDLETEVEPTTQEGRPRLPSTSELLRFTSDVTIPAAILILKTNIEALKLLRRALRMADGSPPTSQSSTEEVRRRATELSKTTLTRLDAALTDLQDAAEGRPQDAEARRLLDEARDLREDLAEQLDGESPVDRTDTVEGTEVPVDVDAELRSIKDEIDDDENGDTE